MPKYTIQNGSVTVLKDPKDPKSREQLKVGAELELSQAEAKKMDPAGFYLCLTSKYRKGKVAAEEEDDDELEKLTAPAKPRA